MKNEFESMRDSFIISQIKNISLKINIAFYFESHQLSKKFVSIKHGKNLLKIVSQFRD